MHSITIYSSSSKKKIEQSFDYDDVVEFLYNFNIFSKIYRDRMDFIIMESNIDFYELIFFIETLLEKPFENVDKCETVEELVDWLKSFQFLAFLSDELS